MNSSLKKWAIRRDDDFRKYFLGSNVVRCGGGCCCSVTFLGIGVGFLAGGLGGLIAGFTKDRGSKKQTTAFDVFEIIAVGVGYGIFFSLMGALIGGLIGFCIGSALGAF